MLTLRILPLAFAVGVVNAAEIDHVLVVSVDGLGSQAIEAIAPDRLNAITPMVRELSTLNARTDHDYTLTSPNHVGMFTGRPSKGPAGHNWSYNNDPPRGATVHKTAKTYVAGMFDVAHDHGLRTTLIASKTKFSLFDVTWNDANGAEDTVGDDNGRDKIDHFAIRMDAAELADDAIEALVTAADADVGSLTFVHFRHPDATGHTHGWDLKPKSPYLESIVGVDAELTRLMNAINSDQRLKGRTAIVLTSDHGGGKPYKSHLVAGAPENYTIPLLVWTGAGAQGDLYTLAGAARTDPGTSRPLSPQSDDIAAQPLRNSDAGNIALRLLELPPIPGSVFDLAVDFNDAAN